MNATTFHTGSHVDEDDLLPTKPECPICGYSGPRPNILALQRHPTVDLLSCPACRGYSASRTPTTQRLREYYTAYYRDSPVAVTCHAPSHFARHLFRIGHNYLRQKSIAILDYGGGSGAIATALSRLLLLNHASSAHVTVVDLHREPMDSSANMMPVTWYETLAGVEGRRFDLVLASAILEHVPHPQGDLARLLRALRPGGIFYARTPSVAALMGIFARLGIRYDFTYPAHLHDLGQAFWEKALDRIPEPDGTFRLLRSCPSLVETDLRSNPARTIAAHLLKSIWRLAGSSWALVGGWEVLIQRG